MIAPPPSSVADCLVSVIIPVYQGEALIAGAVRSVLGQTHRRLEVWVVDDGSTDGTIAVLKAIDDPRLNILRQSNAGTATARNAALARATGQYIAFLDADDRWLPNKLSTELSAAFEHSDPAIVYSSYYAVGDRGQLLHAAPIRQHVGEALSLLLEGDDFLMPSLCLFDARIFSDVGFFDAARYHEDHDFILRATRTYPIVPTRQRLAVYRQTTSGKCRKILQDFDSACQEEFALVQGLHTILSIDQRRRLHQNVARSLYVRFLMYGFNQYARRLLPQVDLATLPRDTKGELGWFFAKTGINLVAPARVIVQSAYRATKQRWWRRFLAEQGLRLDYD